jgi:branched-chain amino acid transport system permease protein
MIAFLQQIISGGAVGIVYALVALGFVMVHKSTQVFNFAQGELMMLGAFCAYTFIVLFGLPFWIGGLLAIASVALFGAVLDRLLLRRMVGSKPFTIFMLTVGIGFCVRSIVMLVPMWGTDTYSLPSPLQGEVFSFHGLIVSADHAVIFLTAAVISAALFLFFQFTRLGLAMRAISQNPLAASYLGVRVDSLFSIVWALSAAAAALAGVMLAPISFVHADMGQIGLKAIPAAVLGGFDSLPGAIVGGLIIGIVESLAGFYCPEGVKDVAAYVVLLVVLAVKPRGLFGQADVKKV